VGESMKIKKINRKNKSMFWTMYQKRCRLMLGIPDEFSRKELTSKLVETAIESHRHYYPRDDAETICKEYFKRKLKRKNTQNIFL
jgi:NAD+--asparagine ADP-ribosyltransferase